MKNKLNNLKEAFLDLFREVPVEPEVTPSENDIMLQESEDDSEFRKKITGDNGPLSWYMTAGWPSHMANTPTNDDDTVRLVMKMDARPFMFHVATWMELNDIKRNEICVTIKDLVDPNTFDRFYNGILLLQRKQADLFYAWWHDYCAQFDIKAGQRTHVFSKLPNGYAFNANAIEHAGCFWHKWDNAFVPSSTLHKQWCWIVEHCKGKVWVTNTHFLFEDDSDAVHYMLCDVKDLKDQYMTY